MKVKAVTSANYLTNVNGTLFFRAYSPDTGNELWTSDGTEAGTVVIKDIHPSGSSYPRDLTAAGAPPTDSRV